MASIPFAARALVGTVPALALDVSKPVTLQEMVEDFCRQLPNAADIIVNVMQSGADSVLLHCKTERDAVVLLNSGLCFRGHLLDLKPAPNTTWVKLTRVIYGTTDNAIKSRLSEYGNVLKIRREQVNGIGISVSSVKMELKQPIPSRITIAHHPVNVFYRGQIQQCFRCEQTGHISKNCPKKQTPPAQPPVIVGPTEVSPTLLEEPVVDPPLPDSFSEESMDTPINADTGKRQCRSDIVPPAKQIKLPEVSYVQFERERVRLHLLTDDTAEVEHQRFEELVAPLSEETLLTFTRTFLYRHPMLSNPPEEELLSDINGSLSDGHLPDNIIDVQNTELNDPVLPPDFPAPMITFPDMERCIRNSLLQQCGLPVPPGPVVSKQTIVTFRQTQRQVLSVYMEHFHLVYPELMPTAGVSDNLQSKIEQRLIDRIL